jgi:hypothetical protein
LTFFGSSRHSLVSSFQMNQKNSKCRKTSSQETRQEGMSAVNSF